MLVAAAPAIAQQTRPATAPIAAAPTSADNFDDDEIVIIGQRLRGSVVGDIPAENTLDSSDVRATGATSINELLEALAPQIGSVRGRGGGAPVLLLNGQRISGFGELRDVPTEAIQRVEILPEEVALKYGYSADQKVVNIVLRQRFRSTSVQFQGGLATDGGYANGNDDVTRFLVQRDGRTTINLRVAGNDILTENERNVLLGEAPISGTTAQALAARSLVASGRDVRASTTINRQVFGDVSATLNSELEHKDGRSLIGLNPILLDPFVRETSNNTAHAALVFNGTTKSQWRWTVTGTGDLGNSLTRTNRNNASFPSDRGHATSASADLEGTINGELFKLPAGDASATLTLVGSAEHLDASRTQAGVRTANSLSRTTGEAKVNLDLPVSRRNSDFSALGNLTINANAEVDRLSDVGTRKTIGAGANFSPVDRLNFLASFTHEEGAPTINQLGDPVLLTPGGRIFDFATGQTVIVDATTGGNRDLRSNSRNVVKLSANWQPFLKADLHLRADYVRQKISDSVSNLTVSSGLEAAFPGRFVRNGLGRLVSVDLRPVNFDSSRRDQIRIGFDFSQPLKSRRPSQAAIDQFRAQFDFGRRGVPGIPGAPGTRGATSASGDRPLEGQGGSASEGGFGRRGGDRGPGGSGHSRGRVQFSLTDTLTFADRALVRPSGPVLDYLHGDATGSNGGTPRHKVEAQFGYFNNGAGARLSANFRSGTKVNSLTGDDLRFSSLGTFDLRLFANPGATSQVSLKHPWLRGTQFRFEVANLFNARPRVRDAAGIVPTSYQPDLLDPLGRTIMISFRKLFLPSPAFFRRQFQREQQPTRR